MPGREDLWDHPYLWLMLPRIPFDRRLQWARRPGSKRPGLVSTGKLQCLERWEQIFPARQDPIPVYP
jgi:hypothetical protein